ncbi:hypothetical protein BD560DRAFT_391744 [Blakeslea trispora]|nr:hypothetical protein BD560DRAFT_391744 [Blakeslea trispora]
MDILFDQFDDHKIALFVWFVKIKCVVLIAEFKHKEQNSCIKSDLVKLSKQMKSTSNTLIVNEVSKPKTYGIQCEGEDV